MVFIKVYKNYCGIGRNYMGDTSLAQDMIATKSGSAANVVKF